MGFNDQSNDLEDIKKNDSVQSIAHGLEVAVKIFAAAIFAYFSYLALSDAPLEKITEIFTPSGLIKIGLTIFFFGWFFGANDDIKIQKLGYPLDEKNGVGLTEILAIITFMIIFLLLYYYSDRLVLFQALILSLLVINIISWRLIIKRTSSMINSTSDKAISESDEISYLKCLFTLSYMNGRWQRIRFSVLLAMALIQLLFAIIIYNGKVPDLFYKINLGRLNIGNSISYIPGIMFIAYAIVSELWMKMYRIKVFSDFSTLDFIKIYFSFQIRKNIEWPPIIIRSAFDFKKEVNQNYNGVIDVPFL